MNRLGSIARWLALIAGGLIALIFALLLLGAHVYALPYLAPYGSLILDWFSPWFVVLPLIGAALIWLGGPKRKVRLRKGLGLFAIAVAAVGAMAVGRMVAAAQAAGVPIQLAATLASHAPLPAKPDADLVYSTFDGKPLRLVVYRPQSRTPAPVLLYIHGGGWVEGDRFAGGENMRWFARRGWLTIAIDYPLSSRDRHMWNVTSGQVGCALAWVNANAGRFGGDAARVSLMGDSAGGNLALVASYRANAGTLPSACGGAVPRIAAVATVYPAVHLAEVYRSDVPMFGNLARRYATAYLGGSPEAFPERYRAVDPASYIGPKVPPTLIIVGENDHLLPAPLTYRFAEEAKRAGVAVELIRVPYGQHLFDQATNSIGNQLVRGATLTFLEGRGAR